MTPQDLIARFDELAEAPNAPSVLRTLILRLAVEGRLVPQLAVEGDAVFLLQSLRPLAVTRARPRGENVEARALHELPSTWQWARFDDVAVIASNLVAPSAFPDAPHVAPDNIEKKTGRLLPYRTVREDGVTSTKHRFFAGQILYSKIRPNLSKAVAVDFDGLCSADMYPIRPLIDRGYVHLYILSEPFLSVVTADDNRLAMPKVNQEQLSAVPVPVPPLAEQKRIVARVDELMKLIAQLDAARTRRQQARVAFRDSALSALQTATTTEEVELAWVRVRERFEEFVEPADGAQKLRGLVQRLAVTGQLVPQEPLDGDARPLLEALADRRGRSAARPRRTDALALTAPRPGFLPPNWAWVPFGETHINRDGERVPVASEEREHRRGRYDYYGASGVIDKIDDYLFDTPLLLVGEDGANLVLRSTPIAFMARGRYWVNNHAHVLDSVDEMSLRFLAIFVNATDLKPYLTGTAQPKLNQARMNSIPCGFPPLAEQRRIVARVDELMKLIDALDAARALREKTHSAFASAAVHGLEA